MENNENLVTGTEQVEVTENVEKTTEQTPKLYTEEEVNEIAGKRAARKEAKIRKEYERQYGDLVDVLKAGTGKDNVTDMTDAFKKFYEGKGVKITPSRDSYSQKDNEVLAQADADDIIQSGYDEVVEEVDRLAKVGAAKMTAREKAVFKILAEHRQNIEKTKELSKLGVTEDVYNSKEFQSFASKFNANTPIADIYDIYNKTQPKKDIKPMGSMKTSNATDNTVKDFYTRDEALKFTKADFDKNPALFKAVEASMLKW